MKRFTRGERVKVTNKKHPLAGRTGTVWRLRMSDNGAWVTMDADLPPDMRYFLSDDPRYRNAMMYPDECEPEGKALEGEHATP